MDTITKRDFENLTWDSQILASHPSGKQVLLTHTGNIVKVFPVHSPFSSNLWSPYCKRFADNATALRRKGIPCPEVTQFGFVRHLRQQMLVYPMLEGHNLGEEIERHESRKEELIELLAKFLAQLHDRGVLFRDISFDNILVQPNDEFALIDILHVKASKRPLSLAERIENMRQLVRQNPDLTHIREFGWERFFDIYLHVAEMQAGDCARMRSSLEKEFISEERSVEADDGDEEEEDEEKAGSAKPAHCLS